MPAAYSAFTHMDRKAKKPLMEKRRRARINQCLQDLKKLLLKSINRTDQKLEKADILELTVKMLQEQQDLQLAIAVNINPAVFDRYVTGWAECYMQISHYANNVDGFDPNLRQRMLQHLQNRLQHIQAEKQIVHSLQMHGIPGMPAVPPVPATKDDPKVIHAQNVYNQQRVPPQTSVYDTQNLFGKDQQLPLLISALENSTRASRGEMLSASSFIEKDANSSKSESENPGQSSSSSFGENHEESELPPYDDVTDGGSDSSVFTGGDECADVGQKRSILKSESEPEHSETQIISPSGAKTTVWRPW